EIIFDLDPEDRDAFQDRKDMKEAINLAKAMDSNARGMEKPALILKEVFRFNREILNEGNLEKLLQRIVDAAVELTGAERGVLALRGERRLSLVTARSGGKDLHDPENQISRTILERTISQGSSCITTDAREDVTLQSIASVEELGLRSVLC